MSLQTRRGARTPYSPALELPPPFRLVTLREAGDAFAHAKRIAAEEGAGTLVHVGRFDVVEFALVLEPEEALKAARRALYPGVVALVDALIACAPPARLISLDWPAAILVDGGLVGGARLGWPEGAAEDEVPPWLVFGGMLRTVIMEPMALAQRRRSAALEEEGFDDVGSGRLVESFARHFMTALDAWQEQGFGAIARSYLSRLAADKDVRRDIDGNGDLLVRRTGKTAVERRHLVAALAAEPWFDPETRGPRL